MSSLKLLWLPGPVNYRLRLFSGRNAQLRVFAGELTLEPAAASELHAVLTLGNEALGEPLNEAGWVEPAQLASARV